VVKYLLVFIAILLNGSKIFAQKQLSIDSIQFTTINAGVSGMWQTGTLTQLMISPNFDLQLYRKDYFLEVITQYQYLTVSNFSVINDLWNSALFQYKQKKRFYPFITASGGTAKSFLLNHFFLTGAGIGSNLYKKSVSEYIQVHVFAGYLDFEFTTLPHQAFSVGSIIRANINLSKKVQFNNNFTSYHSTKQANYWGFQNNLILNFFITKNLAVNLNHRLFFNEQIVPGIEKFNTIFLFGVNYQFKKESKI